MQTHESRASSTRNGSNNKQQQATKSRTKNWIFIVFGGCLLLSSYQIVYTIILGSTLVSFIPSSRPVLATISPAASPESTIQVPRFHEVVQESTENGRPKRNRLLATMMPAESSASTAQVPRFHEIVQEITENGRPKSNRRFETSYSLANVTSNQTTSWFKPKKLCQQNCCAETVAISLHQDSHKIINTIDGFELADVVIQHYKVPSHVNYHASILHEDILPCLQPGTIIQLENHVKVLKYFFKRIRPNITVPYLLITSKSDANSPLNRHGRRINQDDLMLNWYGTNPDISKPTPKFTSMPLGLPPAHLQEPVLNAYLEMTNFTNPFRNKDRWLSRPVLSNADIFVQFGNVYEYAKHRKNAWDILCGDHAKPTRGNHTENISCVYRRWPTIEVYTAASKYLFAVSPPGVGYDCHRTYEWLLLGVIPIVMERPPSSSQQLFEDLPVVFMPRKDMYDTNLVRGLQKYITAIQNYTQSAAFLNNTFDKGWKRLFLNHWRRQILKDAGGRDQNIIQDENGNQYYQAWKYTPTQEAQVLCSKEEHCNVGHQR